MINMPEWEKIHRRITKRDDMKCQAACGCTRDLTVHHIIPRAEGGSDDDSNLITLCVRCHNEIEQTDIRVLDRIRAYDAQWHSEVNWYPTGHQPRCSAKAKAQTSVAQTQQRVISVRACLCCKTEFEAHSRTQRFCCTGCAVKWRRQNEERYVVDQSTIEQLLRVKGDLSLRKLARALGYGPSFAPTLSGILSGKAGQVTAAKETELRRRLGLV